MQRKLNSSMPPRDPPNIARDGAAKNIADAPIKPGMVRQTKGQPAAYHHGVTVDDEPNTVKSFTKATPLHSANPLAPDKLAKHETAARDVLTDAATLGRGQKA